MVSLTEFISGIAPSGLPRVQTSYDFRGMVRHAWQVRPRPATDIWLTRCMRFPAGWESTSFDLDRAPHVRGVITRFWRDPRRRKANLCWAVRLQKTSTAIGCMLDAAVNDPSPMAILFPDEDSRDSTLDEQIYPICESTLVIKDQIPSAHKRNRIAIRFRNCRVRLAVGGSKSSVSGYPAKFVFKFEHDKNTIRKSSEAASSWRIESRTTGFEAGVKILEEGSPGDMDSSYAYALLQSPHVMKMTWHVPCPHCREYSQLAFANLKWDRDDSGGFTPQLARRTAWYQCPKCLGRCEDHHRVAMMQSGAWLAEGESITAEGVIIGQPTVDSDTMIFGPLSKLASLLISGWGDVAAEFVTANAALQRGDREPMRKFITETLGEPWDPTPTTVNVDDVVTHLAGSHLRGTCPDGTTFLTMGVDVGSVGDQIFYHWLLTAWNNKAQGAVVDWGVANGTEQLRTILSETWPCGTLQLGLTPFPIGIDTGDLATEIYTLCDSIPNAVPLKGDSSSVKSSRVDLFWWGHRTANVPAAVVRARKRAGIGDLLMVNTHSSQQWRRALTERRLPSDHPGFVSIPADVAEDVSTSAFVQQLANDVFQDGKWQKCGPNEMGDCLRYCRVLAQWYTRNGRLWPTVTLPASAIRSGHQASPSAPHVPVHRPVAVQSQQVISGGFLLSQR